MGRWLRGEAGDAVVEFALLAPVLLLLLFGIFELGRVVDAWLIVHDAAREGARAGALASSPETAGTSGQQAAERYLSTAAGGRTDLAMTLVEAPVVTEDAIEVTAVAEVELYAPLMRQLLAPRLPVRAAATMPRQ